MKTAITIILSFALLFISILLATSLAKADITYIENGWFPVYDETNTKDILTEASKVSFDETTSSISISKETNWNTYKDQQKIDDSKIPVRYYKEVYNEKTHTYDLIPQPKLTEYIDMKDKQSQHYSFKRVNSNDYVCKVGYNTLTYNSGIRKIYVQNDDYTLDEIYQASETNGWNVIHKYNGSLYSVDCYFEIANNGNPASITMESVIVRANYTLADQIFTTWTDGGSVYFSNCTLDIKNASLVPFFARAGQGYFEVKNSAFYLHDTQWRIFLSDDSYLEDCIFSKIGIIYTSYSNNLFLLGGNVGFEPHSNTVATNITFRQYTLAIRDWYGDGYFKDVFFDSCTTDVYVGDGVGDYCILVDVVSEDSDNSLVVDVQGGAFVDRRNTFDLTTEPLANITLYNCTGDVVFSCDADANGDIDEREVSVAYYESDGSNYRALTPFRLVISKDGYQTYNATFNNSLQPMNYNIQLQEKTTISYAWVAPFFLLIIPFIYTRRK